MSDQRRMGAIDGAFSVAAYGAADRRYPGRYVWRRPIVARAVLATGFADAPAPPARPSGADAADTCGHEAVAACPAPARTNVGLAVRLRRVSQSPPQSPPSTRHGRPGERAGADLQSAHSETLSASSRMLVRPRMQGWPISLPTGHARSCSTPQAATRSSWPLRCLVGVAVKAGGRASGEKQVPPYVRPKTRIASGTCICWLLVVDGHERRCERVGRIARA